MATDPTRVYVTCVCDISTRAPSVRVWWHGHPSLTPQLSAAYGVSLVPGHRPQAGWVSPGHRALAVADGTRAVPCSVPRVGLRC